MNEIGELEKKFIAVIQDLISFLDLYDQKRWVSLLKKQIAIHEEIDLFSLPDRISDKKEVLRSVENLFGGMGSLNDIFIIIKGDKEKTAEVNRKLSTKKEAVYCMLSELRNIYK